jgi:hypothetical protein
VCIAIAVQINQVKGLYVEDSDIYGSCPNGVGLDGVAVQYGHVCRSNIHHADWCMYLKGNVKDDCKECTGIWHVVAALERLCSSPVVAHT